MNINPYVDKSSVTPEFLRAYIQEKEMELEQDYNDRLGGVVSRIGGFKMAGYDNLRLFFEGDQWTHNKEDGTPTRVYNYCRSTVLNYTSFLANEPPEDDVPPRDTLDEVEIARAEEVEKLLGDIKDDNDFPVQFAESCQNQSLLGECFVFGPYVEWIQMKGKKKLQPRIRFKNIKRIENVRILWADEDFTEMIGFIFYYRIDWRRAEKIYEQEMKEMNIRSLAPSEPTRYQKETGQQMVTIKIFWNDTFCEHLVEDRVLKFDRHDWGFVPGLFVKNMSHPTRPWGISDIEDILDAQVEYNEILSATRGKINQVAVPHVFIAAEGQPAEIHSGQAEIIKMGPEDKVFPDPMGQSTAPFDTYRDSRKADIHGISMISEVFSGNAMTAKATGRALSVLMQGVNNKVKLKQQYWKVALQQLNANILRLIELYVPKGKDLIQGYYVSDIFFPSILIRNTVEEINKFNAKLQSQYTTMKNIGIPNPKEEVKMLKKELDDESLMIEISKNPPLRMQLMQQMQQMMQQAKGGQQPGGQNPQLTESDGGANSTSDESLPMSSPNQSQQAPLSGGGQVSQNNFRQGR